MKIETTQKDVAIYALREMLVSKAIIADFETNDNVYLFEGHKAAERIVPGSGLYCTLRRIEEANHVKIYAVTRDYMPLIGYMYSFLCVSPYEEDWEHMVRRVDANTYMAYAYVQNLQDDLCSEFGYVAVSTYGGFIRRVG